MSFPERTESSDPVWSPSCISPARSCTAAPIGSSTAPCPYTAGRGPRWAWWTGTATLCRHWVSTWHHIRPEHVPSHTRGVHEGQYLHTPRVPPYTRASTWLFLPHHRGTRECSASTRRVISLAASLFCNINDVNPVGIATCHCKGESRKMERP